MSHSGSHLTTSRVATAILIPGIVAVGIEVSRCACLDELPRVATEALAAWSTILRCRPRSSSRGSPLARRSVGVSGTSGVGWATLPSGPLLWLARWAVGGPENRLGSRCAVVGTGGSDWVAFI